MSAALCQQATGIDPVPVGYYDGVAEGDGVQAAWHRLKFDRVRRAMGAFESHLDIACGPGTFIAGLHGGCSIGVDIAPGQLDFAARRHGGSSSGRHFAAAAADCLPFARGSFDVVTSIELIEHVSEDTAARMLIEARALLRPQGKLVLTTPNFRSHWLLLEPLVSLLGPIDYRIEHITRYDAARLGTLLRRCGYGQVRVSSFHHVAPFLAPLGRGPAERCAAWEAGGRSLAGCLLLAEAMP